MQPISSRILLAIIFLLAAGVSHAQSAGSYPTRPVRMIIPFQPGGASDFVGRILQPKLSEELGQQVVADNRTGASGAIGVELAARASADGYTILLGNVGSIAINPSILPKSPIKPTRDLISITAVADIPGAMAVHPSVPAATVKEFIEYAKARPGQLNFGTAGAGSITRLGFEFFMRKAGIKLVHIPYKGGAGAATIGLLANEVAIANVSVASFIAHHKAGRARIIAVVSPTRISQLPDVQTMAEAGFPELTQGAWQGVFVPAGTPRPVVEKLYSAVIKVMSDPWVVERFTTGGAVVTTSKSPKDFAAFVKSQTEFWAKIVKQIGLVGE